MEHTAQPTEPIQPITNALLEDLFNPSISTLDLCNLHTLTLDQIEAILDSDIFKSVQASYKRINKARRAVLELESQALALARLNDLLKDKPETPAHAESQRKAATKLLAITKPKTKQAQPTTATRPSDPNQAGRPVPDPIAYLLTDFVEVLPHSWLHNHTKHNPSPSKLDLVDRPPNPGTLDTPRQPPRAPDTQTRDQTRKAPLQPSQSRRARTKIRSDRKTISTSVDKHLRTPTLWSYGTRIHIQFRRFRQANAMPLSLLLQLVSTCAIVTGSLCAILAYFRGSKSHQQTLNAQVFLNLTQRHASLIDFRRLEADQRLNDHWAGDLETAVAIREYFDLLSHEFALVDLGILDQRVWQIWQPDIARIVNTQLASEIWQRRTRHLHRTSPRFVSYIDALVTHQRGVFADGHSGSTVRVPQMSVECA